MIFGLSLLYWGLWLAILILWMGRFVTSFLSIYLVSALRLDEGVVGTVVAMYGFGAACSAVPCPTDSAANP